MCQIMHFYTQNSDRAITCNILGSVVFIASVSALAVWNELFAIPVALILFTFSCSYLSIIHIEECAGYKYL